MKCLATQRFGAIALACAALGFLGLAQAQTPRCPSPSDPVDATRWTVSTSGSEVTDLRTGLIWARCSVGQTWTGSSCSGTAVAKTQEQALALAELATDSTGGTSGSDRLWRLPSVKELVSVVQVGCNSPAIDQTALPGTTVGSYWTSTPRVDVDGDAWRVWFSNGNIETVSRNESSVVRLVRRVGQ